MSEVFKISKIESKQKKEKRTGSIILVFLLLLSTLGFALNTVVDRGSQNSGSNSHFNGQYWVYNSAGRDYYFSYSPSDLDFTNIDFSMTVGDLQNKILYIDNPINIGSAVLESNLAGWALRTQPACFGKCELDLPEKNCTEPFIVVRDSDKNTVRQEDKCIFIDGNDKTVNAFVYKILGFN